MSFFRIIGLGAVVSFGIGVSYSFWTRYQKIRLETQVLPTVRIVAPRGFITDSLRLKLRTQPEPLDLALIDSPDPLTAQLEFARQPKDEDTKDSLSSRADAAVVFHTGVRTLKLDRQTQTLYHSQFRFPTVVHPDFRKLGLEFELMESLPLFWGLLDLERLEETLKKCSSKNPSHSSPIDDGHGLIYKMVELSLQPSASREEKMPLAQPSKSAALWVVSLVARAGTGAIKELQSLVKAFTQNANFYGEFVSQLPVGGSVMREDYFAPQSTENASVRYGSGFLRQFELSQLSVLQPDQIERLAQCKEFTPPPTAIQKNSLNTNSVKER